MEYRRVRIERLEKIFDELEIRSKGGIFTNIMRSHLRGSSVGVGRDKTLISFRYKVRSYIKSAFYDLALFVTSSSQEDISRVITVESIDPFFEGLLWFPVADNNKSDPERAMVANLMIQRGFEYLSKIRPDLLPPKSDETITDALKLSNYLTERFKLEPDQMSKRKSRDEDD